MENFLKILAIKHKWEGDVWPKQLCQRSVDKMVKWQVG
jgi:hypothetical protein